MDIEKIETRLNDLENIVFLLANELIMENKDKAANPNLEYLIAALLQWHDVAKDNGGLKDDFIRLKKAVKNGL